MPERGWEAVTIPGAVSGWAALSKRHGRLPFADLFEPAIRYARDGWQVSPVVAEKWALAVPALPADLGWPETFMPHGRAPRVGERFSCPAMAETLAEIAATRGESFYRGRLAAAMVAHSQSHGGAHTLADFSFAGAAQEININTTQKAQMITKLLLVNTDIFDGILE